MATMAALLLLAAMGLIAFRANRRLSDRAMLPMNIGMDGHPGWRARRQVALAFMPGLAALIVIPTLATGLASGRAAAVIALALLGAQLLHLKLAARLR